MAEITRMSLVGWCARQDDIRAVWCVLLLLLQLLNVLGGGCRIRLLITVPVGLAAVILFRINVRRPGRGNHVFSLLERMSIIT